MAPAPAHRKILCEFYEIEYLEGVMVAVVKQRELAWHYRAFNFHEYLMQEWASVQFTDDKQAANIPKVLPIPPSEPHSKKVIHTADICSIFDTFQAV